MFFPFRELKRASMPLRVMLGGQEITLHYRKKALTAWAEAAQGKLLPGVLAYKDGWMAFKPDSEVYRRGRSKR